VNTVEIAFKSGRVIKVICKNFTVKKSADNKVETLTWEGVRFPKHIMYLNLDEIESIVVVK
jgi:hypothetical protein